MKKQTFKNKLKDPLFNLILFTFIILWGGIISLLFKNY